MPKGISLPRVLAAILALLAAAGAAAAQDVRPIGSFERWNAFTFQEAGKPVCYAASQPTEAKGNYSKRGEVFALVTHRPAAKANDVISLVAGYDYKPGSEVEVAIGRDSFKLFTEGDRAWAKDAQTDKALVQAMARGGAMVVKGVSNRGTETADSYSLAGFAKAYQAIGQACGLKS
ncbi:MAG: hypothetical protein HYR63_07875 [Proteobacteria bacterium]|nr:hypothetical protein [Pseudomonadota bacterium]MBI3497787.1 hypothetical protein [Pseudomonadota bacterium]